MLNTIIGMIFFFFFFVRLTQITQTKNTEELKSGRRLSEGVENNKVNTLLLK